MKKDTNDKTFILFDIRKKDGETHESVKVKVDDLRKLLEDPSIDDNTQSIALDIKIDNENSTRVAMSLADLKSIIAQSQYTKIFVPVKISDYLTDLTQSYANQVVLPAVGRDEEIEKCWFYLSQPKRNNVFLIGDVEVGKTTIACELARQISSGICPKEFEGKRFLMLQTALLLKIENDFYFKYMLKRIKEFLVKNRENCILFIDDGILMKTDERLIFMLQDIISSLNIPLISTLSIEDYEEYFVEDFTISKYLNFVYVEEPELEDVLDMVKAHALGLQKQYKIKISKKMVQFAILTSELSETVSFNPGITVNVLDKAFMEAKRKGKKKVDKECILSCYNSYLKLYKKMDEEEKRVTAYHEVGHYVVNMFCETVLKDKKIAFVSILPMLNYYGVNWTYTLRGKNLSYTKDYFLEEIAIFMGGRIAEKKVTSKDSIGSSSDLISANALAEYMVTTYALMEDDTNRSYLDDEGYLKTYLISDSKRREWDKQIQSTINTGYKMAEEILNNHWQLVEIITEELLKEEIMTGEDLKKIVDDYLGKSDEANTVIEEKQEAEKQTETKEDK